MNDDPTEGYKKRKSEHLLRKQHDDDVFFELQKWIHRHLMTEFEMDVLSDDRGVYIKDTKDGRRTGTMIYILPEEYGLLGDTKSIMLVADEKVMELSGKRMAYARFPNPIMRMSFDEKHHRATGLTTITVILWTVNPLGEEQ